MALTLAVVGQKANHLLSTTLLADFLSQVVDCGLDTSCYLAAEAVADAARVEQERKCKIVPIEASADGQLRRLAVHTAKVSCPERGKLVVLFLFSHEPLWEPECISGVSVVYQVWYADGGFNFRRRTEEGRVKREDLRDFMGLLVDIGQQALVPQSG